MAHFIYGGIKLEYSFTTVLLGSGKFQCNENDGEIYEIHAIYLPTTPSGKHISVWAKDDEGQQMNDVTEWRSYDDGKILSFECKKVEHWNLD
ncbi:hypothetical protein NDS46_30460 (plasmid) [Paenibacillus thiaminolyticus]|uniref:hypothetical protein n=1 Tax=Paenibacillus thiaminolyticus TaxID=49283 RepID=UPI00232CD2EF|nr:hypothetical protein [Paenibacillus thiaminolyticus]WCF11672.1 hypothetical protein NDS46_30460 [Paenibacillus thiaminolyticus]